MDHVCDYGSMNIRFVVGNVMPSTPCAWRPYFVHKSPGCFHMVDLTARFSRIYSSRNGSYVWTQTVDSSSGYLYLADEEGVSGKYMFELQVCGNIEKSRFKACNVSSPVNMVWTCDSVCWLCVWRSACMKHHVL